MFKLTEDQVKTAIKNTWKNKANYTYMIDELYPRMERIIGKELLPDGLVSALLVIVEETFDVYPPDVKSLVYLYMPNFVRNLELGEEGEKAANLFERVIVRY